MVAQFVVQAQLRKDLRDHLYETLRTENPDMIIAHSLGSLLCYDFLHNDARSEIAKKVDFITIGSQIGNTFVRSKLWPGRFTMPPVKVWHHLYNPKDKVFTAKISIPDAPRFYIFETSSDAQHSPVGTPEAPGYLNHPNTKQYIWKLLAKSPATARAFSKSVSAVAKVLVKPKRRALLIGIND